jgi:hypothetical protein
MSTKNKIEFYGSPDGLAEQLHKSWFKFVASQYTPPPVPSLPQLKSLLKVAYLATMEIEEGRPTTFTICCAAKDKIVERDRVNQRVESWPFETVRTFSVQEIRRLAVATNSDSTFVWVQFGQREDSPLEIRGLLNLGQSWAIARNAYTYFYQSLPKTLTVRGISPGYLIVYQGDFVVGQIKSGFVHTGELSLGFMDLVGAYPIFEEGHRALKDMIMIPKHEYIREWHEFEWLAYVNVIIAIVNSIKLQGHGGALIVASPISKIIDDHMLRIKYHFSPPGQYLKESFIEFMNHRHKHSDRLVFLQKHDESTENDQQLNATFFNLLESEKRLAESCVFVGKLSGADGALVLTSDLSLLGFGTEIRLGKISADVKVYKIKQPMNDAHEELDSEQFGMRHRSAIKLCSQCDDIIVFVVSQDGGISLVWEKEGKVYLKSDIKTTNLNMILS